MLNGSRDVGITGSLIFSKPSILYLGLPHRDPIKHIESTYKNITFLINHNFIVLIKMLCTVDLKTPAFGLQLMMNPCQMIY